MATKKVDVRRLMREKKGNAHGAKKINSPLARYNSSGQLFCVLCNAPVKSELLWNAHVQGRKHKENLSQLKNKSSAPGVTKTESSSKTVHNNPVTSGSDSEFLKPSTEGFKKRNAQHSGHEEVPLKKAKVTPDYSESGNSRSLPQDFFAKPSEGLQADRSRSSELLSRPEEKHSKPSMNTATGLPADFFDASTTQDSSTNKETNAPSKENSAEALPEGFFDDPKLDAKVRKVEYKDPVEEEWEKFQKAMQMENQVSEAIVEEDDEEAKFDRELMELSEQRLYYLRADALRDKQSVVKENLMKQATERRKVLNDDQDDSDSDSDEFEDLLDWRAKGVL